MIESNSGNMFQSWKLGFCYPKERLVV